jgi:hypothetical protein
MCIDLNLVTDVVWFQFEEPPRALNVATSALPEPMGRLAQIMH